MRYLTNAIRLPSVLTIAHSHQLPFNYAARTFASDVPSLPNCNFKPKPYKGPSYESIQNIRQTNLSPALTTIYSKPLLIQQGYMQWLFDHTGKRYLDMFGGIVTVSVGHCHPKVTNAAIEQLTTLWHTTNIYYHPKIHEYAKELSDTLPDPLKVVYFVNSGSEANDLALHMARLYTKSQIILSLRNGYHGMSPSVMGITSLGPFKYNVPGHAGIHQLMNPDVYRGPWGGSSCRDSPVQADRTCNCTTGQCRACDMYIGDLEDFLIHTAPKGRIAAFIAESIQGIGGTVQFPKDYLRRASEIVQEKGGLFIADEVQTGFGRTGDHFWGFEGHRTKPDIVTMAKGIGNGFPLAAVVTTTEVAKALTEANHFNTFGGNPIACAVGLATLNTMQQDHLQNHCKTLGTYFLVELAKLRDEFSIVGDVRGKGLMIGIEFVADKEKRTPLPTETFLKIWDATKDMGLLVGKGGVHGNVMRLKPPMCVTKEDINFTVKVLRKALRDHL